MPEKITKTELAQKLGISRPTLDKYLLYGFPQKVTDQVNGEVEAFEENLANRIADKILDRMSQRERLMKSE